MISSGGMLVLLGVQNSNSLNKTESGRGDVGGAVNRKSRIACFQALNHRSIIDALTNPLNGARHVHGPIRVIMRVWFLVPNICKPLSDFLSGKAGVQLNHYPSPIAL